MLTVGITAVGSGVGQPVLDSLRDSTLDVKIVGFEASPWAKGAYECDAVYRIPYANDSTYIPTLLKLCREQGVEVLFPGSDTELLPLSKAISQFEAQGVTLIISGRECVRLCRDKLALYQHLDAHGVPFVRTWTFDEAEQHAEELTYPVIAKPRGGSGSAGSQVISSVAEWKQIHRRDDWIVQTYLMPTTWTNNQAQMDRVLAQLESTGKPLQHEEVSIQVLVSNSGTILGRFASINRLKDGVPMQIDPVDDPLIWKETEAFVAAMAPVGLRGTCNIQGRITPEGLIFFEANVRYTGISHVRAQLGYNEVEAGIRHFHWHEPDERVQRYLHVPTDRVGMRQTTEAAVPRTRMDALSQHGSSSRLCPFGRLVLTGGTGYLGQTLVRSLLDASVAEHLILPTRDVDTAKARFADYDGMSQLEFLEWDPADDLNLKDVDAIIHAAAVRPLASTPPEDFYRVNIEGTRRLVSWARRADVRFFLFISSQSVYGTSQTPLWPEAAPLLSETPYAHSKVAGEALVATLADNRTRWLTLRLGALFGKGPGMRQNELLPRFAKLAAQGQPLTIHGTGEQRMDLIHVDDAASAIVKALAQSPKGWNQVYNVGSGAPVSLNELAELFRQAAAAEGCPELTVSHQTSDTGPRYFGMNIESAAQDLSWRPQAPLPESIRELVRMARQS